ncbi:hypothetical protein ACFX2A_042183 [Malus domestica]
MFSSQLLHHLKLLSPILSHGDLVSFTATPTLSGTFESFPILELHPDITRSQVPDLQHMIIASQNCHPMQTRSKSGISKKKQVFSATVQFSISTKPTSFTVASKSVE